ncbi:uncharacterized protein Pyn_32347 [Prunus yedoensis var. nudiflora]|uniref:Heavy metal-associated isoprenylated plant protein 47 n=1 Tax=Prunus yedoensis var. nudiflora TaxID=2094558 RepID=A0A314YBN3_PRUYE|nr:uncharacterized protein Pyn_32347 [Prunus yedoensis var. nudiflora]
MVQQKIVMRVQMNCEKHRTNALKIAAVAKGVSKVSIEAEKEQMEVIGDGVDSTRLTMSLRKKLGFQAILSVEPVKANTEEKKPTDPPKISSYIHYPRPHYHVVHDDYDHQNNCAIM